MARVQSSPPPNKTPDPSEPASPDDVTWNNILSSIGRSKEKTPTSIGKRPPPLAVIDKGPNTVAFTPRGSDDLREIVSIEDLKAQCSDTDSGDLTVAKLVNKDKSDVSSVDSLLAFEIVGAIETEHLEVRGHLSPKKSPA
jgi:hypothetical protein